jgi:predicted nucleic acid-binding protein
MADYYLDASALVKYYIREPGTTWVRGLIDARSTNGSGLANTISIAEASITESAAAFAVLVRTERIFRNVRDRAFRELLNAAAGGRFRIWLVTTNDFLAAAHLTQRHPLKAYDAIQLTVALRQQRALAAYRLALTFVSGDGRLLEAAQAEGLAVENPFDHVAPEDSAPRT